MRPNVVVVLAALGPAGCCSASVNILPKDGGNGQAIATSSKENCALEKAQDEANQYCQQQGKRYVAVHQESVYQGANPRRSSPSASSPTTAATRARTTR